MSGVYGTLARGIESGFSMGRQAAQDEEAKRARKVSEDRQAGEDRRATEEHGLRLERSRFALDTDRKEEERKADTRVEAALDGEITEIEKVQAARQAQGLGVDPTAAARYAELKTGKAAIRQRALDFWSRAKVGQANPMDASGPELRMHMTAATGMLPEDLPGVRAGAADIEAGLETQNWGLVTQGANKAMSGLLKRGVGGASPYGGTVTRKEIIGMDPAIDAAGNEHPNRFIPRLRVYVEGVSPTGQEMYYDAPMTQGGTSEDGDKVVAIDIKKGMDWLGNAKMLADMAERPDVKAKLAMPDGGAAKRYIDELNMVTAAKPKVSHIPRDHDTLTTYPDGSFERSSGGPSTKAPTVHTFVEGGKQVTKQWNPEKQTWDVVSEAPRWKGGAGSGGGGAGVPVKMSPDDKTMIDHYALRAIGGDNEWRQNFRGKELQGILAQITKRMPILAQELGVSPADIGTTGAKRKAFNRTLLELTKRTEAIELFADKTARDMATLETVAGQLQRTNPQLISKPINFVRRQLSSTDQAKLDLAVQQVAVEYERLMQGGALSVAQLPVAARLDAKKLLNGDMPLDELQAKMGLMRVEMQNARDAAQHSRANMTEQIRALTPGGGSAPPPPPPPGGGGTPPPAGGALPPEATRALKEGHVTTFGNGQKWTLRNGRPAQVK